MKKCSACFVLFILSAVLIQAYSQNPWKQKADFGGGKTQGAVGFSIGANGYIGLGTDTAFKYGNYLWEYDTLLDKWTKKADFQGATRGYAVGFSIDSIGYVGTGETFANGLSYFNDFWQYDPANDTWKQKTGLPIGKQRSRACGFSIGNKGYIGTGFGMPFYRDLWEYDPINDTWKQKASMPVARMEAVGFSIGSKGYIGLGAGGADGQGNLIYLNDFWEYDPSLDKWTQKASFPGGTNMDLQNFSINGKGYLILNNYSNSELWEYDPLLDKWAKRTKFPAQERINAAGFTIGNKEYLGTGDGKGILKDFWEYTSSLDTVTGINNYTLNSDGLKIYPNPGNGIFTISFTENTDVLVKMVDVMGNHVFERASIGESRLDIDLSKLPDGIYFLSLNYKEKQTMKKIVINH